MSNARDTLAKVVTDQMADTGQQVYGIADAIIAALPGLVKPLVWRGFNEVGHGRCHYGFGAFGHWYAVSKSGKLWNCMTHVDGKQFQIGYFQKEAAKAAAQAHYTAQIMAAFGIEVTT